ncbi:hypothetical protein GW17_00031821 [Ensete ventricosum]|nr:hypothetical protein GW17_00031821 [Ensete ventricosum]
MLPFLHCFDMYLGLEDTDGGEDESRAEFPCPFCFEDFDLVGLCCHLDDEHPMEVKNEVCPICAARVAMDIVGHITVQHGNFVKEMRLFKGSSRSHSTLSFLRKELQDANLRFSCGDSSYMLASSNAAPDPLLSSFIFNLPEVEPSKDVQAVISDEESTVDEVSDDKVVHRYEILTFCVELYYSFSTPIVIMIASTYCMTSVHILSRSGLYVLPTVCILFTC